MDIWYQFRGCVFTYAVSGILKCPHKTSCLILGTLELMRYYSLIMVCVKGNFANIIRITNELNVNQSQERIPSGPNVITHPSKAGLSPGGHRWQIRDIQSRRNECSITSLETRRDSVPETLEAEWPRLGGSIPTKAEKTTLPHFSFRVMHPKLTWTRCVVKDDPELLTLLPFPRMVPEDHMHRRMQFVQFWEWNPRILKARTALWTLSYIPDPVTTLMNLESESSLDLLGKKPCGLDETLIWVGTLSRELCGVHSNFCPVRLKWI